MRTLVLSSTLLAVVLYAGNTSAQVKTSPTAAAVARPMAAKPDVNYVTQTTAKIVIPDGLTEDDMWRMQQEYYDKVLAKSTLLKHYTIYRHAWGSMGASVVLTLEFGSWGDIDKFNSEEREALETAAWPVEADRKAFLKKLNSFEDPYHRDELYVVRNSMRR
jgi:hypothetical protein